MINFVIEKITNSYIISNAQYNYFFVGRVALNVVGFYCYFPETLSFENYFLVSIILKVSKREIC